MTRLFALLILAGSATCARAADLDDTLALCAACHGDDGLGRAALAAPRLAGQYATYLADQLRGYKQGTRGVHPEDAPGASMRASAIGLTDADIDALAQHYAALSLDTEGRAPAGESEGASLYAAHCSTCHGADARGRGSVYAPNLTLLDRTYLLDQMKAYRQGWRGASDASTTRARFMRSMAALLQTDGEVESVVDYIVGDD